MQITTRSMMVGDAEAIAHFSNQLGYSILVEETLANVETLLSLPDNYCLVAVHDSIVIGWINAFLAHRIKSNPFVEIEGLVMDKKYRGKGIGKLLIRKVEEWPLMKNIFITRVRSNTKRVDAHRFYMQLQFDVNKQPTVYEKYLPKK